MQQPAVGGLYRVGDRLGFVDGAGAGAGSAELDQHTQGGQ